ncbi:hypothetical protein PoB_001283900 [Plakobranchus ocellatus]|uniref:Uncharacterized protein n=1 Tax=Plakobranchus ocellatus TaxID=259542 RepID=A0AAV3YX89_9GAST|nr:hypothetical protein PoB_001283900 [Plakobranchus ocellatus]
MDPLLLPGVQTQLLPTSEEFWMFPVKPTTRTPTSPDKVVVVRHVSPAYSETPNLIRPRHLLERWANLDMPYGPFKHTVI